MTEEEAREAIEECRILDIEHGHKFADVILCNFLISLGYEKLVEEFKRLPKWYS